MAAKFFPNGDWPVILSEAKDFNPSRSPAMPWTRGSKFQTSQAISKAARSKHSEFT